MHLSEVVMDGFKCYQDKTTINSLDHSFNAITGMNGSGKSNILDAIVFVLNLESNKNLRVTSVKELINIHRSECTVTLTFRDDQDNKQEVSRFLDRDGKSKYKMNKHNCTKSTVETFCKSNNISNDFIIMQGHITKILNMNSTELRNMIEESCGIRNYSLEAEKSLKLIQKKEIKIKEAREYLRAIIAPFFNKIKKEKEIYEACVLLNKNKKMFITMKETFENIIEASENNTELYEVYNTLKEIKEREVELDELNNRVTKEGRNRVENRSRLQEERLAYDSLKSEMELLKDEAVTEESECVEEEMRELEERERLLNKEVVTEETGSKIQELEANKRELSVVESERMEMNSSEGGSVFQETVNLGAVIEELTEDILEFSQTFDKCQYLRSKLSYPTHGTHGTHNIHSTHYGTVDENFELTNNKYFDAIFTILGARAKYVICDTDVTASEIIKKADRNISCIPLNKISYSNERHTDSSALNFIKFDNKLEKAFLYLFNGFHIFENKNEARSYCYENKKICVTLDGTVYDHKGTLTGGKTQFSEIIRMKDILHCEDRMKQIHMKYSSIIGIRNNNYYGMRNDLEDMHKEAKKEQSRKTKIKEIQGRIEILTNKNSLLEGLLSNKVNIKGELRKTQQRIQELRKKHEEKQGRIERNKRIIRENKEKRERRRKITNELEKKEMLIREYDAEMDENVEGAEERINELIKVVSTNKARVNKRIQRMKVTSSIDELVSGMEDGDVKTGIQGGYVGLVGVEAVMEHEELTPFVQKLPPNSVIVQLTTEVLNSIKHSIMELSQKLNVKTSVSTMDPAHLNNMVELLQNNSNEMNLLEEKINKLVQDKEEILRSIQRYNTMSETEFQRGFEHINKHLKIFLSYFLTNVDIYITPSFEIKVSFEKDNSTRTVSSLSELSGGQRSLIALSLIFSMLTFNPAPFYIFDEIDAALDLNYTQSIGEIIRNEFKGAQFIIISLKNNMFDNANRIYRVFIQNQKSKICQIK